MEISPIVLHRSTYTRAKAAAASGVIIVDSAQTGQGRRGVSVRLAETITSSAISIVVTVLFVTTAPSSPLQQGCPGLGPHPDTASTSQPAATSRVLVVLIVGVVSSRGGE